MIIILLILGLIIGSFLGAFTYRFPRKISIAKGRSICPNCKHQISWYDNIPVLSYFLLGAKCHNCKQKISLRYPLIEIATAIAFATIGLHFFSLFIASILIAIFVIDLEHQIIPDKLVFLGLTALIFKFLIYNSPFLFSNLLAGFLAATSLLILSLVTKGRGMGLGDVKLALFLGSIVGLDKFLNFLFYSFVSGAIAGIILIVTKKATMKQKIAFGPFLIIGLVSTYILGPLFSFM